MGVMTSEPCDVCDDRDPSCTCWCHETPELTDAEALEIYRAEVRRLRDGIRQTLDIFGGCFEGEGSDDLSGRFLSGFSKLSSLVEPDDF